MRRICAACVRWFLVSLSHLICIAAVPAFAAPDPATTNGNTIYFQGNQSQGIYYGVTSNGPSILSADTLSSAITPSGGTDGIQLIGQDTTRNLVVNFDGSQFISTVNADGIFVQNTGGNAGVYELVTNIVVTVTNVVNGTNVVSTVTNHYGNTGTYTTFTPTTTGIPAGGVTVNSFGTIVTSGNQAHGIDAVVPYGTISFAIPGIGVTATLPFGNGGPVNVLNTGDITIYGPNSQGIVAQSEGGFSSLGGDVDVDNTGNITTYGVYGHGIFASSLGGNGENGSSGAFGGSSGGPGGNGSNVLVQGLGTIITENDNANGILAVSQAGNGGGGGDAVVGGSGGSGGSAGAGGNVTVNGSWSITTYGTNSVGIFASSAGGNGGSGGGGGFFAGSGGDGGGTGGGAQVQVTSGGTITTWGAESHGILAESIGGYAGNGGDTTVGIFYAAGGNGYSAGNGGLVTVTNTGAITTYGEEAHDIFAESVGGGGGSAGSGHGIYAVGGGGASGGAGGTVMVSNSATLLAYGANSRGIYAQSVGGGGGDGGDAGGIGSVGGSGSSTSDGGMVSVANAGNITSGGYSIYAQSIGGGGGSGGSSSGWFSVGGSGGGGGSSRSVTVFNTGGLQTYDNNSSGIYAQSVGGGGGSGGNSTAVGALGAVSIGGDGAAGGNGDQVSVNNGSNSIVTYGDNSQGIFAQSLGGGGGTGGFAFAGAINPGGPAFSVALGGFGGPGGSASNVFVSSGSDVQTYGANSHGIEAESVGGGGGNGGFAISVSGGQFAGAFGLGGKGGVAGDAQSVTLLNAGDITTDGNHSYGLFAQSLGGGGGDGGFSVAAAGSESISASLSFGGSAGAGGNGSSVVLTNTGNVTTYGDDSHAVFAQSLGGGGGSGGFSVAATASPSGGDASLSFGGSGAGGGNGADVTLASSGSNIVTWGARSDGLLAQSVGGGGGSGGFSVAGAVNAGGPTGNFSMGGSGSGGGTAADVTLTSSSVINTYGSDSDGIFAQSLGGGGGAGGFSVSGGISGSAAVGASIGGSGGGGNASADVSVTSTGTNIMTEGDHSYGILAQSVGGGGGNGGFSVAGGISQSASINFSMGGSGGSAGPSGTVTLNNASSITTYGDDSHALFAQSLGGGGGSGGFSVAGGITGNGGALNASIGGGGDGGGNATNVTLINSAASLTTWGARSDGLLAQSVGGGGGSGGFSVAGGITGNGPSAAFSMGGSGAGGGVAGNVLVSNASAIVTMGDHSHGIFVQSLGGGGGSGGFSVSGNISAQSAAVGASIGGSGGGGNSAGQVTVTSTGTNITTHGDHSYGILAQSEGGGGGDGGFSVAGGISQSASVNFSMGGSGGSAGAAGSVQLTNSSTIVTYGTDSHGLFAQSLGGGGGDGGFSVAGGISGNSGAVDASVGGSGAGGGAGSSVTLSDTSGSVVTWGDRSDGILAQSIGGGGGDGGFSVAGGISQSASVNFSMGGKGGNASDAGDVILDTTSDVSTHGDDSHAVFAQSVGGSGGDGGFSVTGGISSDSSAVGASIGGSGNGGGNAGNVTASVTGNLISTAGVRSDGIFVQSQGGSGGDGGFSVAGDISQSTAVSFSMGGSGGMAGNAGTAFLTNSAAVSTMGDDSHGILVQSIGGGGGYGGFSVAGAISATGSVVTASIGGFGGDGGNGSTVTVFNAGTNISTAGASSYGLFAQSVGGGGGYGGFSVAGGLSGGAQLNFSLGGFGGDAGAGGDVTTWNAANITTLGEDSYGIFVQSLGGGGGAGGFSIGGGASQNKGGIGIAIGGFGGDGTQSGNVQLFNSGNIVTTNDGSHGIFAQSQGGSGGAGGFAESLEAGGEGHTKVAMSIGGGGGSGGYSQNVSVTNTGSITTMGTGSFGINAQSTGGGGGDGGYGLALTVGGGTNNTQVSLAIGGLGGDGNYGGAVQVVNSNVIQTFGAESHGIFAQSVGGGGGDGGFSLAGTLGTSSNSTQVSLSVGGFGGDGDQAGNVTVLNAGTIITHDTNSIGIYAKSIGGSGGDGGAALSASIDTDTAQNYSIAIGGFGGDGDAGGAVNVTTTGNIYTLGDNSQGIFAQSVGGGGGNGGASIAASFSVGGGKSTTTEDTSLSLGGFGGDGNSGGSVQVIATSNIFTLGNDSHAIMAQSIGGGGGNGGASYAANFGLGGSQPGSTTAYEVSVGGFGGDGNVGGSVGVLNQGTLETFGDKSDGIFAESIGGGGGDGGNAHAFHLITDLSSVKKFNPFNSGTDNNRAWTLAVGGFGGNANDAGVVNLTNEGTIATFGNQSRGIEAQSIGGGGGDGGNGFLGTGTDFDYATILSQVGIKKDLSLVVGGNGGADGNGAAVTIQNSGDITTYGIESDGILAQSIGGGGGIAQAYLTGDALGNSQGTGSGGSSTIGFTGKIGLGGAAGTTGNGAAVSVNNDGRVVTYGDNSCGIFAQSIGGGGGLAGTVIHAGGTNINIGIGLAFARNGGSGGNGSTVTVTGKGDIVTEGSDSDGIFAQSIGGGGGLGGGVGSDPLSPFINFAGSVGGAGSAGDVTVNYTGKIITLGFAADGIFAQSGGGSNGFGGAVTIDVGSVFAQGLIANGITAQSIGLNGQSNVSVTVHGDVQGGVTGVGVEIFDGTNNSIINYGSISTRDGIGGTAIFCGNNNNAINNYGVVLGDFELGGGANAFNNHTDAVLIAGQLLSVGNNNTLDNSGTVAIGGSNILQTQVVGNFVQHSSGQLQVTLASANSYDSLSASGSMGLDGTLSVFAQNNYLPLKGNTFTILNAPDITGQFVTFNDPYAGNYALKLLPIYSGDTVTLEVVQDSFTQFGFTRNQRSVARDLNSFSGLGGTNGDPRGAALIAFLDTVPGSQLPADFDLISPASLGSMFDMNFASVGMAVRNIQQRMADIRSGQSSGSGSLSMFNSHAPPIQIASTGHELPYITPPAEDDWGVFASGNGQYVDVNGSTNAAGYHFHTAGATLGLDRRLTKQLTVGGSLDYAGTDASIANGGSVTVNGVRPGMYGTWFDQNRYLEGEIGGGYNHYDTRRGGLGGIASGSTDGFEFDTSVGGGFERRCGNLSFGPQLEAHYTRVEINQFTETGSMAPLTVQDNTSQSLLTELGAHLAYDWKIGGVLVRPQLALAWEHEFLDTDRAIDSRLASGAGTVFQVTSPSIGRDGLSVDAGVGAQWTRHLSTILAYHGDIARTHYISHSVNLIFNFGF